MGDQRLQVDAAFGDPLHGERERAFEIGMNARGDDEVLEQRGPEFDAVDRMGRDAEVENLAKGTCEFNRVVQCLSSMPDGFDDNFRQVATQNLTHLFHRVHASGTYRVGRSHRAAEFQT